MAASSVDKGTAAPALDGFFLEVGGVSDGMVSLRGKFSLENRGPAENAARFERFLADGKETPVKWHGDGPGALAPGERKSFSFYTGHIHPVGSGPFSYEIVLRDAEGRGCSAKFSLASAGWLNVRKTRAFRDDD